MTAFRSMGRIMGTGLLAAAALAAGGCSSIRDSRGFIADPTLTQSVQPGIDNKQSVQAALGQPSFESQFGEPTWYYVSSVNERKPFARARIGTHSVLAVQFDAAGNVSSVERSGIDKVAYISPDSDRTPTLGRDRSFFEDLFGNIGAVGAPGSGAPGGPGGP
ncbi:outer membrane protein assembly factor BamE [Tsuneonella troitsensis]|jgi:outer membrane protein assembly factor BamE (lipoprotein component of BamABCDE complex)|uniref:outer membrane protein assembly factor BamE n=1 Tax=Tsuneonella troitsensis TaxID=292222 RepID=UPI00070FA5D8|nr:outer membrane protein assembly factor BamE [Tsuneonella troitsensis]